MNGHRLITSPVNARKNSPIEHMNGTTSRPFSRLDHNVHTSSTVSTGTGANTKLSESRTSAPRCAHPSAASRY